MLNDLPCHTGDDGDQGGEGVVAGDPDLASHRLDNAFHSTPSLIFPPRDASEDEAPSVMCHDINEGDIPTEASGDEREAQLSFQYLYTTACSPSKVRDC